MQFCGLRHPVVFRIQGPNCSPLSRLQRTSCASWAGQPARCGDNGRRVSGIVECGIAFWLLQENFDKLRFRRCGAWCGSLRSQHACKLVGARGHAVSVDLEDLSQITRNFQDAAVAAITGMSGTIATVSSAIRKRMRMMPERAVTAGTRRGGKDWPARIAKWQATAGAGGAADEVWPQCNSWRAEHYAKNKSALCDRRHTGVRGC